MFANAVRPGIIPQTESARSVQKTVSPVGQHHRVHCVMLDTTGKLVLSIVLSIATIVNATKYQDNAYRVKKDIIMIKINHVANAPRTVLLVTPNSFALPAEADIKVNIARVFALNVNQEPVAISSLAIATLVVLMDLAENFVTHYVITNANHVIDISDTSVYHVHPTGTDHRATNNDVQRRVI